MQSDPHHSGGKSPEAIAAGWYPDGSGSLRWWDGTQWTEHTHAAPETTTVAPEPQEQPTIQLPTAQQQYQQPEYQQQVYQQPGFQQPVYQQHFSGGVPGQVDPQQPAPRKNKWLAPVLIGAAVLVVGGAIGVGALVLNMSSDYPEELPLPSSDELLEDSLDDPFADDEFATDPDSDTGLSGSDDMFAEREQFMLDQQLPLDGSMLKAVTPEQKAFIEEVRKNFASNGITEFTEFDESIALALAADACETSILNSHEMAVSSVRMHAMTSPLVSFITEEVAPSEKAATTADLMSLAALGTSYMCPADAEQWTKAIEEIGLDW